MRTEAGQTALSWAAAYGDESMVRVITQRGGTVNRSDEELDLDTLAGGQTNGPTFVNRASQNSWTVRDGSFADANELDGTDEQERLAAWRRDHENDAYLQAQGTNDDASATVQLVSDHEMSGGRFVQ